MQIFHEAFETGFEKWYLNSPHAPSPEFPVDCPPITIHSLPVDPYAPHDHPWDFETFVLCGGYEEEHYFIENGVWKMRLIQMLPGQSRFIPYNHVHRVSRLLDGKCMTITRYHQHVREARWYPEALDAVKNTA